MTRTEVAGLRIGGRIVEMRLSDRKSTDIVCGLIFLIILGFFSATVVRTLDTKDFRRVTSVTDSLGKVCDSGVEGSSGNQYKHLYIEKPEKGEALLSKRICVKRCPQSKDDILECRENKSGEGLNCANFEVYSTVVLFDRICLPTDKELYQSVSKEFYGYDITGVLLALTANYKLIILSLFVAIVSSFLYTTLLRLFAWKVVCFTLLLAHIGMIYAGKLSWNHHEKLLSDSEGAQDELKMKQAASSFKLLSYVVWGITTLIAICCCVLWRRIKTAVEVLAAACKFVSDVKSIIKVPLIFTAIGVCWIVVWIFSAISLYSKGNMIWRKESIFGKIDFPISQ